MAPKLGQNGSCVVATHAGNRLAQTSPNHNGTPPGRSTQQVVEEFLNGLRTHGTREGIASQGGLSAFFLATHEEALRQAYSDLQGWSEAAEAVSRTYLELLERRTTEAHFFRALKCNVRDLIRRKRWELGRFESMDKSFDPMHLPGEDTMAGGGSEEFQVEPVSDRAEDQDPLDILIQREDERADRRLLAAALYHARTDRRFWWIRQKKWARGLEIAGRTPAGNVNESAGSIE